MPLSLLLSEWNRIIWNVEISHFLIIDICGYKTNGLDGLDGNGLDTHMNGLDFNTRILGNTWPEAVTVRSLLKICNHTKNELAQSYL